MREKTAIKEWISILMYVGFIGLIILVLTLIFVLKVM